MDGKYGGLCFIRKDGTLGKQCSLHVGQLSIGASPNNYLRPNNQKNLEPYHCFMDIAESGIATLKNNSKQFPVQINGIAVNKPFVLSHEDVLLIGENRFLYKNEHAKPQKVLKSMVTQRHSVAEGLYLKNNPLALQQAILAPAIQEKKVPASKSPEKSFNLIEFNDETPNKSSVVDLTNADDNMSTISISDSSCGDDLFESRNEVDNLFKTPTSKTLPNVLTSHSPSFESESEELVQSSEDIISNINQNLQKIKEDSPKAILVHENRIVRHSGEAEEFAEEGGQEQLAERSKEGESSSETDCEDDDTFKKSLLEDISSLTKTPAVQQDKDVLLLTPQNVSVSPNKSIKANVETKTPEKSIVELKEEPKCKKRVSRTKSPVIYKELTESFDTTLEDSQIIRDKEAISDLIEEIINTTSQNENEERPNNSSIFDGVKNLFVTPLKNISRRLSARNVAVVEDFREPEDIFRQETSGIVNNSVVEEVPVTDDLGSKEDTTKSISKTPKKLTSKTSMNGEGSTDKFASPLRTYSRRTSVKNVAVEPSKTPEEFAGDNLNGPLENENLINEENLLQSPDKTSKPSSLKVSRRLSVTNVAVVEEEPELDETEEKSNRKESPEIEEVTPVSPKTGGRKSTKVSLNIDRIKDLLATRLKNACGPKVIVESISKEVNTTSPLICEESTQILNVTVTKQNNELEESMNKDTNISPKRILKISTKASINVEGIKDLFATPVKQNSGTMEKESKTQVVHQIQTPELEKSPTKTSTKKSKKDSLNVEGVKELFATPLKSSRRKSIVNDSIREEEELESVVKEVEETRIRRSNLRPNTPSKDRKPDLSPSKKSKKDSLNVEGVKELFATPLKSSRRKSMVNDSIREVEELESVVKEVEETRTRRSNLRPNTPSKDRKPDLSPSKKSKKDSLNVEGVKELFATPLISSRRKSMVNDSIREVEELESVVKEVEETKTRRSNLRPNTPSKDRKTDLSPSKKSKKDSLNVEGVKELFATPLISSRRKSMVNDSIREVEELESVVKEVEETRTRRSNLRPNTPSKDRKTDLSPSKKSKKDSLNVEGVKELFATPLISSRRKSMVNDSIREVEELESVVKEVEETRTRGSNLRPNTPSKDRKTDLSPSKKSKKDSLNVEGVKELFATPLISSRRKSMVNDSIREVEDLESVVKEVEETRTRRSNLRPNTPSKDRKTDLSPSKKSKKDSLNVEGVKELFATPLISSRRKSMVNDSIREEEELESVVKEVEETKTRRSNLRPNSPLKDRKTDLSPSKDKKTVSVSALQEEQTTESKEPENEEVKTKTPEEAGKRKSNLTPKTPSSKEKESSKTIENVSEEIDKSKDSENTEDEEVVQNPHKKRERKPKKCFVAVEGIKELFATPQKTFTRRRSIRQVSDKSLHEKSETRHSKMTNNVSEDEDKTEDSEKRDEEVVNMSPKITEKEQETEGAQLDDDHNVTRSTEKNKRKSNLSPRTSLNDQELNSSFKGIKQSEEVVSKTRRTLTRRQSMKNDSMRKEESDDSSNEEIIETSLKRKSSLPKDNAVEDFFGSPVKTYSRKSAKIEASLEEDFVLELSEDSSGSSPSKAISKSPKKPKRRSSVLKPNTCGNLEEDEDLLKSPSDTRGSERYRVINFSYVKETEQIDDLLKSIIATPKEKPKKSSDDSCDSLDQEVMDLTSKIKTGRVPGQKENVPIIKEKPKLRHKTPLIDEAVQELSLRFDSENTRILRSRTPKVPCIEEDSLREQPKRNVKDKKAEESVGSKERTKRKNVVNKGEEPEKTKRSKRNVLNIDETKDVVSSPNLKRGLRVELLSEEVASETTSKRNLRPRTPKVPNIKETSLKELENIGQEQEEIVKKTRRKNVKTKVQNKSDEDISKQTKHVSIQEETENEEEKPKRSGRKKKAETALENLSKAELKETKETVPEQTEDKPKRNTRKKKPETWLEEEESDEETETRPKRTNRKNKVETPAKEKKTSSRSLRSRNKKESSPIVKELIVQLPAGPIEQLSKPLPNKRKKLYSADLEVVPNAEESMKKEETPRPRGRPKAVKKQDTLANTESAGRGRPPGSKNKKKSLNGSYTESPQRGRPPGSKNKRKSLNGSYTESPQRGRPPGSKNKRKSLNGSYTESPQRGRPPGSKNKKKSPNVSEESARNQTKVPTKKENALTEEEVPKGTTTRKKTSKQEENEAPEALVELRRSKRTRNMP